MNTFVSASTGFSPYELVFIRHAPTLTELEQGFEAIPEQTEKVEEYVKHMRTRLDLVKKMIFEEKLRQQHLQKYREAQPVEEMPLENGDLVMIHRPLHLSLKTQRKNVS